MPKLPHESDDLLGVTIAHRYCIISRLGVGGMGVAYRAWDEDAGVPVVVKIPKQSLVEDPTFAERFRREIRLLQGLSHPHIVPIVDVGAHDGLPFVVMRFLPGGSLSNRRLRDDSGNPRPNPPEMLHLWLPAVADALDHVHAQGVIHRDVKPANVFFDAYWSAFLGDFGIAKILSDSEAFDREETLTGTNIGVGTQEYMAPEQFTPKAKLDGRTDQYALAVMVYEMLAGSRPFRGESAHVVVEILTQPAPLLDDLRPELPLSLVTAVHRGLSKKPAERYGVCREFAAAVLSDVRPMADEPGVARLLCPGCSRILKLREQAAGRQGNCPKCKGRMMVAADLGALWLVGEERHGEAQHPGEAASQFGGMADVQADPLSSFRPLSDTARVPSLRRPSSTRRRPRRNGLPLLITAGAMLAGVVVALTWSTKSEPRTVPGSIPTPTLDPKPKPVPGPIPSPTPSPPPGSAPITDRTLILPRQGCDFSAQAREFRFPVQTPRIQGGVGVLEIVVGHSVDDSGDRGMHCELLDDTDQRVFKSLARSNGVRVFKHDVSEETAWTVVASDHDTSNGNWATVEVWLTPKEWGVKDVAINDPAPAPVDSEVLDPPPAVEPATDLPPQPPEAVIDEFVNSVGMRFKRLPAGEFQMGDPDGRPTEVPHKVTLTRPFFMGVHEVTNAQWQQVMGRPPSRFRGANNPVENVAWAQAKEFCDRLSGQAAEKDSGRVYRLPTSAEWEYACRAGTATRYYFGDNAQNLPDHAWFFGNANATTHPVGRKSPNPWGLYDLYGNVWEWCSDWRGPYDDKATIDPQGPPSSELSQRVLRGGCWETNPEANPFCSGVRLGLFPTKSSPGIGLRVACDDNRAADQGGATDVRGTEDVPQERPKHAEGESAVTPEPAESAAAGESPIDLALEWIAAHQLPDGGWSFDLANCPQCAGQCSHSGHSKGPDRCGATAMAMLTFLGRGYTHREGPYRSQLSQGVGFLVGMVQQGRGKAYATSGSLYSQGLAAIVLSECLEISGDERLRGPAQAALDFIVQAQDPAGGGWRYSPRQPGDTSSFGWQLTALHSGQRAGLKIPPVTVKKAVGFLDAVQVDAGAGYGYTGPGDRPGTSAVGLLCRMYLGWGRDHEALRRGLAKLATVGPTADLYYDYYATRLFHQVGGDEWNTWSERMTLMLAGSQSSNGHEAGSWYEGVAAGHGAEVAGRLYCTALATMILEVPAGLLPIYQKAVGSTAREQLR